MAIIAYDQVWLFFFEPSTILLVWRVIGYAIPKGDLLTAATAECSPLLEF